MQNSKLKKKMINTAALNFMRREILDEMKLVQFYFKPVLINEINNFSCPSLSPNAGQLIS
jgi:hypothetical protein